MIRAVWPRSIMAVKNDFSKGPVWKCIMSQAIPLTVASLVHVLYNVVDRMYLGHMDEASTRALTGVGLVLPIISFINACYALFSSGGAPLCSIARGRGDLREAERIMGNTFTMLVIVSLTITAAAYAFPRRILALFGAGDATMEYALGYFRIYMAGTLFAVLGGGMNAFINAQGFAKMGMITTLLGAVLNLILDPVMIYLLGWGVRGAALATVLSQFASAAWVMGFLLSKKTILRLRPECLRPRLKLVGRICGLGLTGFIANGTNAIVQAVSNRMLGLYGGDLYIGIMTVIGSVREIIAMPLGGLTSGCQPVLGFNYGAREYARVRRGIRFTSLTGAVYTFAMWLGVMFLPGLLLKTYSNDPEILANGIPCMRVYFIGFVAMSFMFAGQSTFVALGKAKKAVCFSLLRKAVIVTPLALLLPRWGLGAMGVFWAEPISNVAAGIACYVTMLATVIPELKQKQCLKDSGADPEA